MAELTFLRPLARCLGRMRWIRFGIRDRFARFVENPDRTLGYAFASPFLVACMWAILATSLIGRLAILVPTA